MRLVLSFPFGECASLAAHTHHHDTIAIHRKSACFFFACFAIESTRTHAVDSYKSESQPRIDGNANGKHFRNEILSGAIHFYFRWTDVNMIFRFVSCPVHYDWHVNIECVREVLPIDSIRLNVSAEFAWHSFHSVVLHARVCVCGLCGMWDSKSGTGHFRKMNAVHGVCSYWNVLAFEFRTWCFACVCNASLDINLGRTNSWSDMNEMSDGRTHANRI